MNRKFHGMCRVLGLCLVLITACSQGRIPIQYLGPMDQAYLAGERAFQNGQYREALDAYHTFLESGSGDPRLAEVYLKIGQAYFALTDLKQARGYMNRVISDFPDSQEMARAKLFTAWIEYQEGNSEVSLAQARLLIRTAQDRDVVSGAYLLRGRIFLDKGDLILALTQWKKCLLVVGEGQGAISLYREMAEIMEDSITEERLTLMAQESPMEFPGDISLFVLGKRAWESGEPIRASQIFEKFFSLFPSHPLQEEAHQYVERGNRMQSLSRVRLGAVLPLSGRLKEIGKEVLQGIQLSVDRLNARFLEEKIELVARDSTGDPKRAAAHMRELSYDSDIVAVIGPVLSPSVVESVVIAEEASLPIITPTATAEGIGGMGRYIFRNAMTNEMQARTMARYAVEQLGLLTFVVLAPDVYYGTELNQIFVEEVTALGGRVICSVFYERGTVDYGPQIRTIIKTDIEGVLARNAVMIDWGEVDMEDWFANYFPSFDAAYLPGYAEDVGLIAPQLAYYNVESVQLLGSHNWNSPELIRRGEQFLDGAIFTDGFFVASPHTDIVEFLVGYRRAYGEDPTLFAAQAYDAAEMILQVLYKGAQSRQDVRNGLAGLQDFPGISGLTSVLPSGEIEKELFLIRVENGFLKQIN